MKYQFLHDFLSLRDSAVYIFFQFGLKIEL